MNLTHSSGKKHFRIIRAVSLVMIVSCSISVLSQSVFAKNTYVISDGNQVTVHSTYETDPTGVLNEVGVELDNIDMFTTNTDAGVSNITIRRGQRVTIDLLGQELQAVAYQETVGQLLERLNISTEGLEVSVPLNALASNGMLIRVYSTGKDTISYTVEIPCETIYQKTNYLKTGTEVVLQPGANGQALRTEELDLVNGKEVGRTTISESILQESKPRIVAVGTGNGKPKSGSPIIGEGVIITPQGKVLNFDSVGVFEATAYMTIPPYTFETTATGTKVHKGTVAVDPSVIPYGTKMYIVSCDGEIVYGEGTAEDCGPAIKNDRIDVFYFSFAECSKFARRDCFVYFLTE